MRKIVLQSGLIIFGGFVGSEIIYQIYKRIRKSYEKRVEINQVLITNNLSSTCMISEAHVINDTKNCDNPYCYKRNYETVIRIIDSAQHSINICMFIFTMVEIANAVIRAYERGVNVKVYIDEKMSFSSGSQIQNFIMKGKEPHSYS